MTIRGTIRGVLLVAVLVGATAGGIQAAPEPVLDFVRQDLPRRTDLLSEGFTAGDLDGDGRVDLVEGGQDALLWYHNPDWATQPIATGLRYGAGSMVVVRDMDGDGRNDVVTGRYPVDHPELRETLWFGNTAAGWVPHVVSTEVYCHDLVFGDLDGDGRTDAVCDDQFRDEIRILRMPDGPAGTWTSEVVDARPPMGATIADIDADGHPDIVDGRAWYRNTSGQGWPRFPYTTLEDTRHPFFNDYARLTVTDIDGDGHLDVFATLFTDTPHGVVYAFFGPADPTTDPWTAVEVDAGPLFVVHSEGKASFDGTARPQFMVGEANAGGHGFGTNPAPEVLVYRLVGAPRDPAGWERIVVDRIGTLEAQAVDVDGDGLADIVGHERPIEVLAEGIGQPNVWRTKILTGPAPCRPDPPAPPVPIPGCGTACGGCRVADLAACAGVTMPPAVDRGRARACVLVARGCWPRRAVPRRGRRGARDAGCGAAISPKPARRRSCRCSTASYRGRPRVPVDEAPEPRTSPRRRRRVGPAERGAGARGEPRLRCRVCRRGACLRARDRGP
jgi:VCBS repeat protein